MKVYHRRPGKRTPKCAACSAPSAAPYCVNCLQQWPMLRYLISTPNKELRT